MELGALAALLVGTWQSNSYTLYSQCRDSCCKSSVGLLTTLVFSPTSGSVAELTFGDEGCDPICPLGFYLAPVLGPLQLRKGGDPGGLLVYSNQHGECVNVLPVLAAGLQAAERLIVNITFSPVQKGGHVSLTFLCSDRVVRFDGSVCLDNRSTATHERAHGEELNGEAPFFNAQAFVVSFELHWAGPPSSLSLSTSPATSPSTAAATSTTFVAQGTPADPVGVLLAASLGPLAICFLPLGVLCLWRRRCSGRSTRGKAKAAAASDEKSGAAADEAASPVAPWSEDCLDGRLSFASFAQVQHMLIRPDAIRRVERLEQDAAGGTTGHGLLHGTTDVGLKGLRITPATRAAAVNEVSIWRRARHPNIVQLHGMVVGTASGQLESVVLVLEWMRSSPLGSYVPERRSSGAFAEQVAAAAGAHEPVLLHEHRLLIDVARALHHVHSMSPPIFHCGLRPSCVLVQLLRPPVAKVSDFSLARVPGGIPLPAPAVASDEWRQFAAPELVEGEERFGGGMDVFAFGRLARFVIMGGLKPLSEEDWGSGDIGSLACALPVATACMAKATADRPSFFDMLEALQKAQKDKPLQDAEAL